MLSRQKIDSITRNISSLTLDGRRLTAEIVVTLTRAFNRSDAEALGSEVAGIVDDILGAQIVQGQPPLSPENLEGMTQARTKALGKVAKVQIVSLRLSVPAATTPSRGPAVPTRPPDHRAPTSSTPPSGSRAGTYSSVSNRAPAVPSHTPVSTPRTSSPLPGTSLRTPSPPPMSATRTSSPVPASSVRPSNHAPTSSPRTSSPVPAPVPTTPSAPPGPPRTPSPPASLPPNVDSLGIALAPLLRDATAHALLTILSAARSGTIDRLALLEGKPPAEELRREACACFTASIYRASLAIGESHRTAAAKVEAVCKHAFPGAGPSATDIGSYIASTAPVAALATRVAALLGCDGDVQAFRAALTSSLAAFDERLVLAQR